MTAETWKRCPFCGNDDGVKVMGSGEDRRVGCFNCGAQGPSAVWGSYGTVESAWNDERCTERDARLTGYLNALADIEDDLRAGMEDVKPERIKADKDVARLKRDGAESINGMDALSILLKAQCFVSILDTMAKALDHVAYFRKMQTSADDVRPPADVPAEVDL